MRTNQQWRRCLFILMVTGMMAPGLAAPAESIVGKSPWTVYANEAGDQGTFIYGMTKFDDFFGDKLATFVRVSDNAQRTIAPVVPSPDGRHLYTIDFDGKNLLVYDAVDPTDSSRASSPFKTISLEGTVQPVGTLADSNSKVGVSPNARDIVVSPDGKNVFIPLNKNQGIVQIDTATWRKTPSNLPENVRLDPSLVGNGENFYAVDSKISLDGSTLYMSGRLSKDDGAISIYDLKNPGTDPVTHRFSSSLIFSIAPANDGKKIYMTFIDKPDVYVWDATQPDAEPTKLLLESTSGDVKSNPLSISPDGKYLAVGLNESKTGSVRIIDLHSAIGDGKYKSKDIELVDGAPSQGTYNSTVSIGNVMFSPDSRRLFLYSIGPATSSNGPAKILIGAISILNDDRIASLDNKGGYVGRFLLNNTGNFVGPVVIANDRFLSVANEQDLIRQGIRNFINLNGGSLFVTGDVDIPEHVVSIFGSGLIDVSQDKGVTVSHLLGDSSTFVKSGAGTLTILGNSSFFTKGTVSLQGGVLVATSDQSLGDGATVVIGQGATLRTMASNVQLQGIQVGAGEDAAVLDTVGSGATLTSWLAGAGSGQHGPFSKVGDGTFNLSDLPQGGTPYTGEINLNGGRTVISSSAALGSGNALNFDGGTLVVNTTAAAMALSKTIRLGDNNGTIEVSNEATNVTLSNTIDGPGRLTKTGPGTLTSSGVGNYAGDTFIQAGIFAVRGGNALNKTSEVNVATPATFTVLESQTIGALSGDGGTTVASGQVLTIGEGDKDSVFAGKFSGQGGVTKIGAGTFVFNGTSDLPLTIDDGTWVLGSHGTTGASVSGQLIVNQGGQLRGTGTIGDLIVNEGGTLAPGNSVGTITVTNATLKSGSSSVFEIGPNGTNDQLVATGSVSLGGKLQLKELAAYVPGTRYTLVSAGSPIEGAFESANQNLPLLNLQLVQDPADPNHLHLDAIRNETPMENIAENDNEKEIAEVLDNLATTSPLYDAFVSLETKDEIKDALGQLSGDLNVSAKSALIQNSHALGGAALGRLRDTFTPGSGSDKLRVAYAKNGQGRRVQASTKDNVFWTQAFGSWGNMKSDGNAAKLNRSTAGVFLGTDTRVGEDWRVGGLFGYSTMTLDVHNHHSSARSDGFHLSLYGGRQWDAWGLRTGLGYSWYSMHVKRSVDFRNYSDSLKSSSHASTIQVFGELGYRLGHQDDFLLEPFINVAAVTLNSGKLNENGGEAALHDNSSSMSSFFTTLGLNGSHQFSLQRAEGMVRGTVGWRRAYGKLTPSTSSTLLDREEFKSVKGLPIDKNAAVVEAGVDFATSKTMTVGVTYSGDWSRNTQSHRGELNLSWKF